MTLQDRDKRALMILGVAVVLIGGWYWSQPSETAEAAALPEESVELAEQRLSRLRQIAAARPGKEATLEQVNAELGERENGLILAETAPQAQAQIVQIVRRLAKSQTPPMDMRTTEVGQIRPYGEDYGEISVMVTFDAHIEQLVNLLADLTAQKEALSTSELHIGQAHPKEKVMNVRMTVSGLVRRNLIPEKKGAF